MMTTPTFFGKGGLLVVVIGSDNTRPLWIPTNYMYHVSHYILTRVIVKAPQGTPTWGCGVLHLGVSIGIPTLLR